MNDYLNDEVSSLISEGRRALRPTDADKARVLTALRGRVANPTQTPDAARGLNGAPAEGMTLGKIAALTAGVLAAVSAFIAQTRDVPETARSQPEVAPIAVTGLSAASAADSASVATPTLEAIPRDQQPVVRAPSQSSRADEADRLAEEVALLTRGQRNFHSGDLKAALAAVNEHSRAFPKGTLAPERTSLRTQILCAMAEKDEPRAEGSRAGRAETPTAAICANHK